MKCSACGRCFVKVEKYLFHIECIHGVRNNFVCPLLNCQRVFHKRYVFKQHLYKKHNIHHKEKSGNSYIPESNKVNCNDSNTTYKSIIEPNNSEVPNKSEIKKNIKSKMQLHVSSFNCVLSNAIKIFISKLYDNFTVCRSAIQDVIEFTSDFLSSGMIDIVEESINEIFFETQNSVDTTLHNCIKTMFTSLKSPFNLVNTEYKRFKYFKKCDFLIDPVPYKFGVSTDRHSKNYKTSLVLKERSGYIVPVASTLKTFLEIPNTFKPILDYHNKLLECNDNYVMYNVLHGKFLSENMALFRSKICFPVIIYFDDFEAGNPLGSHAGCYKLGAAYLSLLSIPPAFSSRLENIFLALLFHTTDRADFGNERAFKILIEELNILENKGIVIQVENISYNVYFKSVVVTGDNLGIHSIMGFVESFSAEYYCRFCTSTATEMAKQTREDVTKLRKKYNYDSHVKFRSYGVKENCVWNWLNSFHVYENHTIDIMHDLYEGVYRYDMARIINRLIGESAFTLEYLNARIQYFSYDDSENIPPPIKLDSLKKGVIIMSASEMHCLVKNFRFLIGDLVHTNNEYWALYLLLLEIDEIVTATTISQTSLELLATLVEEHHLLYMKLFKENLKPKHHFLVHYPSVISKIGPPHLLSSMRFEAKHKQFKSSAHAIQSRKNLPYTLSKRHQLKFCYRVMSRRGLENIISLGDICEVDTSKYKSHEINLENYISTSWYEINGIKYKTNKILLFKDSHFPQFCQIIEIFLDHSDNTYCIFFVKYLTTKYFNIHYRAYCVQFSDKCGFVSIYDLFSKDPCLLINKNNEMLVSKNY